MKTQPRLPLPPAAQMCGARLVARLAEASILARDLDGSPACSDGPRTTDQVPAPIGVARAGDES